MGWCRFKVVVMWVLIWCLDGEEAGACDMQSCTKDFVVRDSVVRKGAFRPYCVHLRDYMRCVQDQAKACHGDLMFHGVKISIETMMEENRCEEILAREDLHGDEPTELDAVAPRQSSGLSDDPCGYKGAPSSPAHCGLFGDPHLKTFGGTFMTCRVKGAWPMLSSAHLAIQVTNEAVAPDFRATATTKVTVLIKGNTSCGTAKTYEASGESLPKAFVDGTTYSGSNKSHPFADVTESLSGRHVLIKLRSISAVVSIRRIGKYLSVSVTLPEAVVGKLNDAMQLCVGGCPRPEKLTEGEGGAPRSPVMSEEEALARCLEYNITDYYLDSCVFDLITTGDLTFREAAALSLKELLTEDSRALSSILKNCSAWPCVWRATSGQGHGGYSASDPRVVALLVLLGWSTAFLFVAPIWDSCRNSVER